MSIRFLSIVILFCSSFAVHAENKQIFLLKQETPGHIVYASLLTDGESAIANIAGMGASKIKKDVVITVDEFNYLWAIANSKELMVFEFKSGQIKDLADSNYYTVNFRIGDGAKTYLRIPVKDLNGSSKEFVTKIKKIINTES